MNEEINIIVEGGLIQQIYNIPKGIKIIVHDYDTDGIETDDTSKDQNGDVYVESTWED